MPGSGTWLTGTGGGTVGTISSDTNSLVPGDMLRPEWDNTVPTIPVKSRPAGNAIGGYPYLDTVLINPLNDAANTSSKIVAFATPPGVTALNISIPMRLPPGQASGSAYVAILNLSNNVPAAPAANVQQTFTLGSTLQSITLSPTGLAANTEYRLQLRPGSGNNGVANQVEAGPATLAVAAGQGSGLFAAGFERYHLRSEDLWDNVYGDFYAAGGAYSVMHESMGARVVCETTATSLSAEVYPRVGSSSAGTLQQYVVLVNGRFFTTLSPFDAAYNLQHIGLTLPAGRKRVEIIAGIVGGTGILPSASIYPCSIRAVYWPTGQEFRVLPPPRQLRGLVVYGDSIAGGQGALYPSYTGWVGLVRQQYPGWVAVEGRGGGCLFEDGSTAAARVTLAKRIAAQRPQHVWLAIGTNDYGLSIPSQVTWNAANFGIAYANLLDLLRQYAPDATIFAQTPILRASETANTYANTLGQYRAQITTAAGSRPWVVLVDGLALVTAGDIAAPADGLHPSATGHERYAGGVLAQLASVGAVPGGFANVVATASTAWTPPQLVARDMHYIDVVATGAVMGDLATAEYNQLLPDGVVLTQAVVSAANQVTVALWNTTAIAQTVPAGNVSCVVTRRS